MLKLNKTEFVVISSKHSSHNLPQISYEQVSENGIKAVWATAKNIGAVMDQTLSMVDYLKSVSKSSYTYLHNIGCIRMYLTKDTAVTLMYALVTVRLDHFNALLYGLTDSIIHQLQLIQNHAAKIVVCKKNLIS